MKHPETSHEELIIRWFERSQKQRTRVFTIFDQFISLWFSFNSWGTYLTKKDTDREMINQVKTNNALLTTYSNLIKNDDFKRDVSRLAEYGVWDMRPNHEDKLTTISDVNDFGQILDAIYQVRCNLFHGQKSIINPHDFELVELSFRILSSVFKPLIVTMTRQNP